MMLGEVRIEDDAFVIPHLGHSGVGAVEVYKPSSNTTDMSSCRGSYPSFSKERCDSAGLATGCLLVSTSIEGSDCYRSSAI